MVNVKYDALYTDNLGCERAEVYLSSKGFKLNVRGCNFECESLDFDFTSKSLDKVNHYFYMKDNELIDYSLDIKIPMILTHNNEKSIEKFLLSVERHKNYYKNSLSFLSKGSTHSVKGYNLKELLFKMKKELSKKYNMECSFLSMPGTNDLKSKYENKFKYSMV